MLFSDESPFCGCCQLKEIRWIYPGEEYDPKLCKGTIAHPFKINVWGSFTANSVGNICLIDGIMNQYVYKDFLQNEMMPTIPELFRDPNNFKFLQDNDPKHKSRLCMQFLIDNNIQVIEFPPQSPDLNPIENLWSILDQQTRGRKCSNDNDLFESLEKSWYNIDIQTLQDLVHSMPERCALVIKNPWIYNKILVLFVHCINIWEIL